MTTIVVFGPPGAGKGTRIAKAKEDIAFEKVVSISTGNILRKNKIDVSNGKLIPDAVIIQFLQNELKKIDADIVILDGVPRTVKQAKMMKEKGIKIDRVIYLPLSEEEAVRRAKNRLVCSNANCQEGFTKDSFKHPKVEGICDKCGSKLTVRSDDNEETVRKRLQIYHDSTEPVLEWFRSKKIEIRTIEENDSQDDFLFALLD